MLRGHIVPSDGILKFKPNLLHEKSDKIFFLHRSKIPKHEQFVVGSNWPPVGALIRYIAGSQEGKEIIDLLRKKLIFSNLVCVENTSNYPCHNQLYNRVLREYLYIMCNIKHRGNFPGGGGGKELITCLNSNFFVKTPVYGVYDNTDTILWTRSSVSFHLYAQV